MKPVVIAFIFARGGSVGVPRKNLREVGGKPLLVHAIEAAQNADLIDRVMVSTDDQEIASIARESGAEVPFMRPIELAGSDSPEFEAWRHAVKYLYSDAAGALIPDVFVAVPTTSPLKVASDLDRLIEEYLRGEVDIVLGVTESVRNPHMNILMLDDQGYARVAIEPTAANPHPATRQSAPQTYDITTVGYAVRPEYILEAKTILEGRIRTVLIPSERAYDIDTQLDLEVADFLIRRRDGVSTRCSR